MTGKEFIELEIKSESSITRKHYLQKVLYELEEAEKTKLDYILLKYNTLPKLEEKVKKLGGKVE